MKFQILELIDFTATHSAAKFRLIPENGEDSDFLGKIIARGLHSGYNAESRDGIESLDISIESPKAER